MNDHNDFFLNCFFSLALTFIGLVFVLVIPSAFFIHWETSDSTVSGIVYNEKENAIISGNTTFGIRASENTIVNENTVSTFCLPPNSSYTSIIREAAADKTIKVVVKTRKMFKLMAPWKCMDNVTVEKVDK